MQEKSGTRTGVVTRSYLQPYPDPIRVSAGERVSPDFAKVTDFPGWVWCTDARERSGWVPRDWMEHRGDEWRITRNFDAIELTVDVDATVIVHLEIAGFYWITTQDGRTGWVPSSHVRIDDPSSGRA